MRFSVKYTGTGGEVDMSTAPILYKEHNFMKREHKYSATDNLKCGVFKFGQFHSNLKKPFIESIALLTIVFAESITSDTLELIFPKLSDIPAHKFPAVSLTLSQF